MTTLFKIYIGFAAIGPLYFIVTLAVVQLLRINLDGHGDVDMDDGDMDDMDMDEINTGELDMDDVDMSDVDMDLDDMDMDDIDMDFGDIDKGDFDIDEVHTGELDMDDIDLDELDLDDVDLRELDLDDVGDEIRTDQIIDIDEYKEPKEPKVAKHYKIKYFSAKAWVGFFTLFGCTGIISIDWLDMTPFNSLILAFIVAFITGSLITFFKNYTRSQSTVNEPPYKFIGKKGVVTLAIPYKRFGRIRLKDNIENRSIRAKSIHRRKLKRNETVIVLKYNKEKHFVIVKEKK